jgi:hypothetical protein
MASKVHSPVSTGKNTEALDMLKRALIVIAILIGGILGYGYWHAHTHASFHVQLDFKDADGQKPRPIPGAEIIFLDAEGSVLAKGISDAHYNYVHLIHPTAGDCHEIEKSAPSSKEARESWQECFEHLSTWIPDWAGKVRQVDLRARGCRLKNIPVTVSRYNSDWYLWWVPHPHIGGKPYAYYSLRLTIAEKDCER